MKLKLHLISRHLCILKIAKWVIVTVPMLNPHNCPELSHVADRRYPINSGWSGYNTETLTFVLLLFL